MGRSREMQTTKMPFGSAREAGCLMFRTKTPQFFKIILDDSLRDGKLGIPRKFVRNHGNSLSSPVLLKVPSGAVWQVELVKSDGDMWFQNGWKKFADFYSVSCGHFLVFEFKGDSEFHVLIFDTSALEIEYPLIPMNGENESNYRKRFQEPKDEEAADDVCVEILEDCSPSLKAREKSKLACLRPKKKIKINSNSKAEIYSKLQRSVPPVGNQSGGVNMKNPAKDRKQACPTMQFKGKVVDRGMHNKRNRLDMDTGRMKPLLSYEKANALQRVATAFNSDNPFFMVAIQPSYVYPGKLIAFPASFARKFFNKDGGKVVLCSLDGRSWSLKYSINACHGYEAAILFGGWKQFVKDNNLEVGDVCVFELIERVGVSLRVSIFRFAQDAHDHPTQGNFEQFKCRIPDDGEAEGKFNSYPSFTVVLQSYHFRSYIMRLSSGFFGMHILPRRQIVMLQVADRSWPVQLLTYSSGDKVLSRGWAAFVKENSLRVGDACTFKMFKSRVVKVSIFRNSF